MRTLTFLFLLISFVARSQPCSGPGRVPELATAVCGTLAFNQQFLPDCSGPDLPDFSCGIGITTSHSVWYKFHCYQSGTLNFLITPVNSFDDYDWALMDHTGLPPQDVLTTNLDISVNISGITGTTGCTPTGIGNLNCAGSNPQYNISPNLIAGHDYLLLVTNWTNSGAGYSLDLSGGTAVLTDNQLPTVSSVGIVGCNTSLVKIIFSEDILCSSLTPNGSEFSITNGTHVITSLGSSCSIGSNTFTELTLNLQNPLPPGNYQLVINDGTDINTLLDVCQTQLITGSSFPFTVPAQPAPVVNNVLYTGCAPTVLKVALNKPISCSSVTAIGNEFSISPINPGIGSVQSLCSSGSSYTDTLILILQNPLVFGNYQLTIDNGSDGNTLIDTCGVAIPQGYQFPFVINQLTTAPIVQSVLFDECEPYQLVVNFDKPVACYSFSPSGSGEFSITPGTIPITSVTTNCTAGNQFTTQVIIQLTNNLPAGNFSLHINNGSDGNTLTDSCFAFTPVNSTFDFVTTVAPRTTYDSVIIYDRCTPMEATVFYSKPVLCNSVVSINELYVTGPSPVTLDYLSGDMCSIATGYGRIMNLHFTQPITVPGTYTIHNRWGSDGNSVMDTCYATQDTLETISFDVIGPASAFFPDDIHWGCIEDTLFLSHPGGNGVNSWDWTFSDGTTASGQNVTHIFPVSTVTATVQLIVSNGFCSDTFEKTYTLDNAINAVFSTVDTACINSNVSITNNSTGNNITYLWEFGDNTQSSAQNPVHVYAPDNTYNIQLIITNDHGCMDTLDRSIVITKLPVVDFSGLNAQYCSGDVVTLTANLLGNIDSYTWNNGNGNIFHDNPVISYQYYLQGNYIISLTANDRYCGDMSKDSAVKVYQVPNFDMGKDKKLCPGIILEIGMDQFPGFTYLWNTGSTSPKILTPLQPGFYQYELQINNNGCTAEDEITVTVLNKCLIRVPGAFTPNSDGLNDRLKAINADLATNFSLKVYNRFGQLLFSTTNPLEGWDGNFKGNPADMGTYVWQLNYVDPETKMPVSEKGTSILIR